MTDFSVRSDHVDVEQIMRQIRSRIREKRGVDYTEEEIRELASVKLEKFLDPRGVRSDLLEQFRRKREASLPPNFGFEDTTLFETHRAFLRFMRRILRPILKLFFNPNPLIEALHIQSKLNAQQAAIEPLYYEVMHNLVLETTRLGIEVKNLKMRVESMSSRLDFDERRARALEGVVQYRPGAVPPLQPPTGAAGGTERPLTEAEQAERRSRRRRRRGRRRPADAHTTGQGFAAAGPADAPQGNRGSFGAAAPGDAPQANRGSFGATSPAEPPQGNRGSFGAAAPGDAPREGGQGSGSTSSADAPRESRGSFGETSPADGPRENRGSCRAPAPADAGGGSHES
jgi:hypothetical protein